MQSQNHLIRIFPSIPNEWQNVTFTDLRAEGAFLISAEIKYGQMRNIQIKAEKGGELKLLDPFDGNEFKIKGIDEKDWTQEKGVLKIRTRPGETILLSQR